MNKDGERKVRAMKKKNGGTLFFQDSLEELGEKVWEEFGLFYQSECLVLSDMNVERLGLLEFKNWLNA